MENPVDWEKTNCVICNFRLPMASSNFPCEKITTYLDFVMFVEHSFIRNIFEYEELNISKSIQTLENYHQAFRKTLQIVTLLNTNYSTESDIEDISDDCVAEFRKEMGFDNFSDLYLEIENTQIKNLKWEDRRDTKINKIITFVYCSLMDFLNNKFEIETVVAKNFFKSVRNFLCGSHVMHHSHVTGEIKGYAYDFCKKRLRENQNFIPVFAHNLFGFDFFFIVKGIRLCVWRTKQLNIGGNNLTNVQNANIGCQVKFIDTIKYYQQSLSFLAKNANETEKINIRQSCRKFIE